MPGSATNRLRSIHAKSTTVRQLPAGRGAGPTKRATMRDQWHASTRHSYAVLPGSATNRLRSGHANSTTVRQLSRRRGTDTTVLRTRTWRLVSRSAPRNSTRFAAQYPARGLPCERFKLSLAPSHLPDLLPGLTNELRWRYCPRERVAALQAAKLDRKH